ncbi:hypothetical protein VP01_2693g2 [Puccinia sorghi]|uniref:Tet-like 2OG-Fe(II) oxygenase domain-containing protein n=1 Tax=Puccinia sorghi TaxID=27349 RepID=A0A0L6V4I3_9BASI|nr:hypothetical protein VP01_2693g2 [Puccinia sorghi]
MAVSLSHGKHVEFATRPITTQKVSLVQWSDISHRPSDQCYPDYCKSSRVGDIIGELFKKLAHEPFKKNHNLMKKYNLPSLSDLSYGKLPEDSTCSPHINSPPRVSSTPLLKSLY